MANQNFRVKKGLEVGLGATFLYADDTGVGINSTQPRANLDVRGTADILHAELANLEAGISTFVGVSTFKDDVYVDTHVYGDIVSNQIESVNLDVSGITTSENLRVADTANFDKELYGNHVAVAGTFSAAGVSSFTGELQYGVAVGSSIFGNTVAFSTATGDYINIDNELKATKGIFEEITFGDATIDPDGNTGISSEFITTKDLYITGVATFTTGVTTQLNAENIDAGITTTTDLYIENLLYDSNSQIGVGNSVLVTQGGKLVWTTPDLAGIATFFRPGSTFYVSENGTDSPENDGLSPEKAWASLTYALSQVTAGTNDIIQLTAGTYTETFPLSVPDGVTVRGAGQRATTIQPSLASRGADGFQLGDACTVEDITISGMLKDGAENYAFTFRSGATIATRSPYISNVTIINKGSVTTATDPYGFGSADSPPSTFRSANGVMVDGAVLNSASLEAAFLLNEVTMFVPAATGIHLKNGARSEQINCFIYFAARGIYGETDLTTGLYGAGRTRLKLDNPSGTPTAGETVEYYDADGTTVLASGVIDSYDGTYTYLEDAGTGQFVVPRNRVAKVVDFVDTAQISTAQAKFGSSSLDVTAGNTDGITVDSSADFGFGTGDFTVEFWIYRTGNLTNNVLADFRSAATDNALVIAGNGGNEVDLQVGTTTVVTGVTPVAANQWVNVTVTRESGTLRLFIDGALDASATVATDLGVSRELHLGDDWNSADGAAAYYDELRITKGAAKYTAAFTPSTVALEGDKDTSILLHFEGANGATETSDDVAVLQDIQFGGKTADKTTLADYSEFGADVRNVGSAVEYGQQGVVGEGQGVKLRLVSINFNHVGALGDISNDFNTASKAQEVVNVDGKAQIAYVSIDELGNFRVGDEFSVNQETGEVSFSNTTTDLTSLNSLTITDGVNNSVITPTSGRFGDVLISGNAVETVSGDLNLLAAGGGDINIIGDTNVIGVLTAQVINIDAIQKGDTSIALDDADSQSGGVIRFNTDNVEAMRIDDNQRVGINSTAPRSELDVRGELNTTDLVVSGFSTFTGVATFAGGVEVTGDLAIEGDLSVDELTARNLKVTGFSTFADQSFNAGVGTSLDLINLEVAGVTTTTDLIVDDLATIQYLGVAGVATVGLASVTDLQFTTGVGYTMTVDTVVAKKGYFEEIAFGDIDVAPDGNTGISSEFITTKDLYITGIATFTTGVTTQLNAENIDAGISTIGYANITNGVVGVATITTANVTTAYVGHTSTTTLRAGVTTTADLRVEGDTTVTGKANITGLVDITAGARVGGALTVGDTLEVTGATTLSDTLSVSNHTNLGSTLEVAGLSTFSAGLDVSGISSFQDPVSFASSVSFEGNLYQEGDVEIEGNLTVSTASSITANSIYISGVTSTSLLQATSAVIGLVEDNLAVETNVTVGSSITSASVFTGLTSTTNLEAQSAKISEVTTDINFTQDVGVAGSITAPSVYAGVTSTTSLQAQKAGIGSVHFNVGFGTDLTVENLNVDAISADDLGAEDLVVSRNVSVAGLSTFTGISTFGSDVFVEGNLSVKGDITLDDMTLDEATIVDLTVTGFTTTNNLRFASGIGTHLELETLNVGVSTLGVVTATTIRTTGSVAIGDTLFVTGGVVVGGGITFQGDIEVNVDADFQGNVNVGGIATIRELEVVEGTVGILGVTTSLTVGTSVTGTQILDVKGVAGFGTDVRIEQDLTVVGAVGASDVLTDTLTAVTETNLNTLNASGIASLSGGLYVESGLVANELNVSGVSTFVGVSTFASDVFVDGNITISGDIFVDDINQDQIIGNNLSLNPNGIGTIPVLDYGTASGGILTATKLVTPNADFVYGNLERANIGVATIGVLEADGIDVDGDISINKIFAQQGVIGILTSSVIDVGNTTIDTATIGTATVAELNWTDGFGAFTQTTELQAGIGTLGIASITTAYIGNGSATAYNIGTLDVDTLRFEYASGTFSITNRTVVGLSTITTLNSSEANLGFASITNSTTGLSTVGVLSARDLNFSSGVGTHLELSTEEVGVSTVGFATITEAYVGVATVGLLTVTQNTLMIGDLTVLGTANVGAGGSGTLIINGGGQITGIVTIGENSITLDGRKDIEQIIIGAGATISGMTTAGERSYIQIKDGLFEQLNASGIATVNSLVVDTTASIGSDVSIGGTVSIGATAYVTGDLLTTGGIGAGGTVYSTLDVAADRDLAVARDASVVGNAALGSIQVSGASTFTGISTFGTDVFVEGNLRVKGDITVDDIVYDTVSGNQLNIAGVGTIGIVSFTTAVGSSLTVTNLDVSTLLVQSYDIVYGQAQFVQVSGFATHNNYSFNSGIGTYLRITDLLEAQDIDAPTGVATFSRVDSANIEGQSLTVDEISSNLSASLNNVNVGGALTVQAATEFVGLTTFTGTTEFDIEPAFRSGLNVTNGTAKVTGLTTTGSLVVQTTASVNDLTVRNDALVKGDLTVEGTVSFEGGGGGGGGGDTVVGIDSITTRFLSVTGIATLANSNLGVATIGVASVTTLEALDAQVYEATINAATVETADIQTAEIDTATIQNLTVPQGGQVELPGIPVSGGIATFSQLRVTGVSTFVGVSTFSGDVYIKDNLFVGGDQVFDSAQSIDLRVSGVITASRADIGIGTVTNLVSTAATITNLTFTNAIGIQSITAAEGIFENIVFNSSESGGGISTGGGTGISSEFITTQQLYVSGITSTTTLDVLGSATVAGSVTAPSFVGELTGNASSADQVKTQRTNATGIHYLTFVDGDNSGAAANEDIKTSFLATINPSDGSIVANKLTATSNFYLGLDEVTASATELNYLDGSTPGTATAGKALVVDVNRNLDNLGDVTAATAEIGFTTTTNFYVGTAATITSLTVGELNQTGGGSLQLDSVEVGFVTATNAYVAGILTVTDINSLSDRRVKENIRNVEKPLEKIDKLNGVHFDFVNSGKKSMGVIAQEVEAVFPELISGTFPKSVNYNGLIGVLIESVKELKAQNEEMRAEIDKLKKN